MSMFSDRPKVEGWTPPESLPELGQFSKVSLDVESTGKQKFRDLPVGIAIKTPKGKYYLPFGHGEGGNLDQNLVRRWAQRELRGKRICNLNTGFDAELMRNWGVDLEEQGCSLHDVGHSAALLNENRYSGFSLDSLGKEYAGRGKTECPVPPQDIHRVHSSMVGGYAEDDAELAWDIDEAQAPLLEKDELGAVTSLEDRLIWANNHIERNGARLDRQKLISWREQNRLIYQDAIIGIFNQTGIKMNPNARVSWESLFGKLGIDCPTDLGGNETFDAEHIKAVKNDLVQAAFRAKRVDSVYSKYLDKYFKLLKGGDIARFQLHQLRGDEFGTVTGRYSSANFNVQQVMKVEKQIEDMGDEFIIRELFIPDDGFEFFGCDASQIEFRLFAHYANDAGLIRAYNDDPDIDFHLLVTKLMNPGVYDPGVLKALRKHMKHNNFGVLYGMGRAKLARRLGLECVCGCDEHKGFWDNKNHADGCPAIKANDIMDEYHAKFPAAKRLMNQAMQVAERRGFVKTILGRRRRYPDGQHLHSALNAVIQGSAADVFKLMLDLLYRERSTIGIHKLRMPVHDEQTGDVPPCPIVKGRLVECFRTPVVETRVPITWDMSFGRNWKECA
jgi:DNA polymerase I-like protein with 3'-5' exonuclease and polymerase domains